MQPRMHISSAPPTHNNKITNNKLRTRPATARTLVLLFASLAFLIVPAQAGLLSGVIDGTATLTPTGTPGIYIQNFVGDGTDATYGAFTATSQSMVDFSSPPTIVITNGMLTDVFAGGKFFGTGSGGGTANGQGSATFTVNFIITGGTGIFEHQTGEVTIKGTITQTSQTTESIDGTYLGNIGTPEPSSLSLMFLGASVGYRFLSKRRV
jgi:hypothetical protein